MLEITNRRGETMEVDSNLSIAFEKNNTLFNGSSVFVEDLTYNGNAPLSPNNKLFFGNGQRIGADPENYTIEVSLFLNSVHICSGTLTYKVTANTFDFIIKPNFAAIRDKATSFNFPAVKFLDILYTPDGKSYKQVLKEMATLPNDYPCVFIPVKNSLQFDGQDQTNAYNYVNNYDGNNYIVTNPAGANPFYRIESPFFSLSYILSKCCQFLGFKAEGSIFTDATFLKKKIYSRFAQFNASGAVVFVDSSIYMPDMLIADFFKQIGARYNLSFVFDFSTKIAYIHTFGFLKNKSKVQDLSNFLSAIKEVNPPESKGFAVSLKPDTSDEEFLTEEGNKPGGRPDRVSGSTTQSVEETPVLKIGNLLTSVELDVSTLKVEKVLSKNTLKATQQIQDTKYFKPNLTPTIKTNGRPNRDFDTMRFDTSVSDDQLPDERLSDNKLRIVNYEGLIPDGVNKTWPQATADNLGDVDAEFYNFLQKSKIVKAIFQLPSSVFNEIRLFDRIAFYTPEGDYHIFLIQKINTDLKKGSYLEVEMLLRLITVQQSGYTEIQAPAPIDSGNYSLIIHTDYNEITEIPFELWIGNSSAYYTGKFAKTDKPTRNVDRIFTFTIPVELVSSAGMQIRFYNRKPITATNAQGITIPITDNGAYSTVTTKASANILVNF